MADRTDQAAARSRASGHLQQLVELVVRCHHGEGIGQGNLLDGYRWRDAHPSEELDFGGILALDVLEQRHHGLRLDHFRLPHVQQCRLADREPRLGQLEKDIVALDLLARDLDLSTGLQCGEVLVGNVVPEQDAGVVDVGFHRPLVGLLKPGPGKHLSVQLPLETQAVARTQDRRGRVGQIPTEPRFAGPGIAEAAGYAGRRQEASPGIADRPPGRRRVVQHLTIGRARGPGLVERLLEGERRQDLWALRDGQRVLRECPTWENNGESEQSIPAAHG